MTDRLIILLVDDQPSKLLTYEAILAPLDEHLIKACSASEALDCLLKHDVAVLLIDVCMPELNGYELARIVRQHPRYQKTAIIFVSAILMTDLDRLRGYECGAVDYVPVPVVPEILRAKVSVFTELHRKTRDLERLNQELEHRVAERTAALEAKAQALHEADRRKDDFLALLAHELRNPLAPISSAIGVMRLKDVGEEQRAHARDLIQRQVGHLVRLIDDLLDVSRITRDTLTLQRGRELIGLIVDRAVETIRPLIDARGHDLTIDLPSDAIAVEGDGTRLVQVLSNVLHNAAKFMDDGGRIVVRVTREGTDAIISVSDSGPGIAPDFIPRVFDLFVQGSPSARPREGGLGIGLALARRLVTMHGGELTVASAGLGHGAEFRVRLPAMLEDLDAGATPGDQPPPAIAARRVLVVDDNRDAAKALAWLLGGTGHAVRIAHDGVEALAVATTFEPHVVLLDLGMPRMDGYETARRLRANSHGPRATLVALTGWGQEADRRQAAAAGFDRYLVKPVAEHALFEAIGAAPVQPATGSVAP